jgi:hypothetical protein
MVTFYDAINDDGSIEFYLGIEPPDSYQSQPNTLSREKNFTGIRFYAPNWNRFG